MFNKKMKNLKFNYTASGILLIIFTLILNSCRTHDKEEYRPVGGSNRVTSVYFTFEDQLGNDLLKDADFVKKIEIKGLLFAQKEKFKIEKLKGIDENVLHFSAELPDEKVMQPKIVKGTKESFGKSTMILFVDKTQLKFDCYFKYVNSFPEIEGLLGGTGIHIQKFSDGNRIIDKNDNNQLIVHFIYDGKNITVK